jgi:hypothetical protein
MAIGHVATDINVGFSGVSVKRGEHGVERGKTNSAVWLVLEGVIRGSGKTAMTASRFGGDREQMQERRRSRSRRLAMKFEKPFEQRCSYIPGTQCYGMGFGRSSTERKNDQHR